MLSPIARLLNISLDTLLSYHEMLTSAEIEEIIKKMDNMISEEGYENFTYSNGSYTYHDTYVGGEQFVGEEAIWYEGKSQYAMNYAGRVLDQKFSGDFLKEALRQADKKMPFRGPEYYQSGQYIYKCNVVGDFCWFQGYEEIYCDNERVYECYFHGGVTK
ncbi:putative uncharacterized protein [Clostridium sp. CAG:590]|nr:putative uncharacterized protein [Clostridium sp. CAG:590]